MTSNMELRKRWARALIERGTGCPAYGSAAWLALPEGDARKVASVVIAAEAWEGAADTLEDDLRREVEVLQRGHKSAEDAEYVARRDAHRAQWSGKSTRPHPANRAKPVGPPVVICIHCQTPTSPWSCSCGQTRVGGGAA